MSKPGSRVLHVGHGVQPQSFWSLASVALAGAMAALTTVRFWFFSAPYPPGLDGAQWLSYGRTLVGGAGRSAESTYAPLIPILAHGLCLILGSALGLRVLAASVLVLLASAVWMLSVRVLGVTWGSLAAALVLPCTAMAEPFFYGGYPQQASLAFGLCGLIALLCASRADRPAPSLAVASIMFLLASATHLLFGPLLLASGALLVLAACPPPGIKFRFQLRAVAALTPAFAVSALVARAYLEHGYSAPLDASQRTLQEAWLYATREAPGLWAIIVIGGIATSFVVVWKNRARVATPRSPITFPDAVVVGMALAAPSSVLVIASGQPRLAPPLLLGGAMLFAFGCRAAARTWDRVLAVVLAVWVVATLWLAGTTTGFAREFASYYQVLDASLLAATRSIPSTSGVIAVAADRRGWPIGWWVEALQEQPVFTGSNPQWLAFPEEVTRADATARLFASTDTPVLRERAAEMGVVYLVMRKWDWIGWQRWIDSSDQAPAILYDDDETIVLEILPDRP